MKTKYVLASVMATVAFAFPSISFASQISAPQANAILNLLTAFGVDQLTINNIRLILLPTPAQTQPVFNPTIPAPTPTSVGVSPTTTVTPSPTAVSTAQTSQSPSTPTDQSAITVEFINHSAPDVRGNLPFGIYMLRVRVLDANGKPNGGTFVTNPRDEHSTKIPIVMTAANDVYGPSVEAIIDTNETLQSKDWYHQFGYAPTQKGPVTITFTSGNLTKIYFLDVE